MKKFEKLPLSDLLKLESYARKKHEAQFDRLDLVIEFRPGKDGKGMIVKHFKEGITAHDNIVKLIEEQMFLVDGLKKVYNKKNRLFRNLDSAWNVLLDTPTNFFEYIELQPKVKNAEERLKNISDAKTKAQLQTDFDRYQQLHPVCSNQLIIYNAYSKARDDRDEAVRELLDAESELNKIREEEKVLASLISDDHVLADEMKRNIAGIFPNIQIGYILSRLNGEKIEDMEYNLAVSKLLKAKSPHKAIFLRYDYRYDPFTLTWNSLAELRDMGVCLEDPMLQITEFVNSAAKGKIEVVRDLLQQGHDPNTVDYTGCTALIMVSANKQLDIVQLLYEAGADVNCRDQNMMTPLLYAASRGYIAVARHLIALGADKKCSDKNRRDCLYFAVQSGEVPVAKFFLNEKNANKKEEVWGYTPLHLAASLGNLTMVRFLLDFGCSIYSKDKKNRHAEALAKEFRQENIAKLLQQQRWDAPGQFVYEDLNYGFQFWIGSKDAMEVKWCGDTSIGFTHVLSLRTSDTLPKHAHWLEKDESIKFLSLSIPDLNDEDKSTSSWNGIETTLSTIIPYFTNIFQSGAATILICDDSGVSTAPAVLATLLLIRFKMRISDTIELCRTARPSVLISPSLRRGLQDLQRQLDEKVINRLNNRIRNSNVISSAF